MSRLYCALPFMALAAIVGWMASYALDKKKRRDALDAEFDKQIATLERKSAERLQSLPSQAVWYVPAVYFEQLKDSDPITWAATQPREVKPWRHLDKLSRQASSWQAWEFENGPRLVRLLSERYGEEIYTSFHITRNGRYINADEYPPHGIRQGQSAGILFHLLAEKSGLELRSQDW